ncbi:MAG: hypothetical protein C4346_07345, partial [Chloroflexota bacterium]
MHFGGCDRVRESKPNSYPDPYPTEVSDEEWAFTASSLTLMDPDAPQRRHDLREVFNGLRSI